jgi:hypothetical protein
MQFQQVNCWIQTTTTEKMVLKVYRDTKKTQKSQNNTGKEETYKMVIPDFKTSYKATVIKTV